MREVLLCRIHLFREKRERKDPPSYSEKAHFGLVGEVTMATEDALPVLVAIEKEQIAVLREQFHVFDLNGSGFIEYDELRQGLKRLGYQISDEGIEHLFELVGSKDQRLSFEQFIT